MRILLVTLEVPFPPVSGHRLHLWSLIKAMAEDGHELALVSLAQPGEEFQDLQPLRELVRRVDLIPSEASTSRGGDFLRRLRALPSTWPYAASRYFSQGMTACLRERLASDHFDVVVCDEMYPVVNLPPDLAVPVIVDTLHVAYVLLERYARHLPSLFKRIYARIEARKMHRWEAAMCGRVAALGVCSELEGDLFRQLSPGVQVVMIPNVVDVGEYQLCLEAEERRVLFMGAMDWYPNQDAANFFVGRILPHLHGMVSDFTFVVSGRNPPADFRSRFELLHNVEVTGTVPDMRDEIARAAVCVVPLRIGSGTRLKILEAAAMGKPIVSTHLGAEGLEFVDGEEIILADVPEAFAAAVAGLLTNQAWRQRLGQAARRRVEQQYSLMALREALRTALNDSVGYTAGRP
ncbi:MAG TPA: glycosyltransferase family 4 protein [Terriglobales bacterium]